MITLTLVHNELQKHINSDANNNKTITINNDNKQ